MEQLGCIGHYILNIMPHWSKSLLSYISPHSAMASFIISGWIKDTLKLS